jgi:SpoVK/Ycf46/Vps4 family AAA+-type ATPase
VEGDSEVMLMNMFEKARVNAPSILIFDDLNSVASSRKGEIGSTFKDILEGL